MSKISCTPALSQPARQAVIIPFPKTSQKKVKYQACIFCGKTIRVQNFKGKAVCLDCLHQIPAIFSFG